MFLALSQTDKIEQLFRPFAFILPRDPGQGHRQHYIVNRIQIRHQVTCALLPDKADLFAPIAVHLTVAHAQQIIAVYNDTTGGRSIQPTQNIHQRRLATTAGADNPNQFALLNGQIQLAQCDHLQLSDLIDFD